MDMIQPLHVCVCTGNYEETLDESLFFSHLIEDGVTRPRPGAYTNIDIDIDADTDTNISTPHSHMP